MNEIGNKHICNEQRNMTPSTKNSPRSSQLNTMFFYLFECCFTLRYLHSFLATPQLHLKSVKQYSIFVQIFSIIKVFYTERTGLHS